MAKKIISLLLLLGSALIMAGCDSNIQSSPQTPSVPPVVVPATETSPAASPTLVLPSSPSAELFTPTIAAPTLSPETPTAAPDDQPTRPEEQPVTPSLIPTPQVNAQTAFPTGQLIPLTELGSQTYHGFTGGLYPGGRNEMPEGHLSAGLEKAALIVPRDTAGNPDANGQIVLLSVGMSNTMQEFCGSDIFDGVSCDNISFIGRARQDPEVNDSALVIINGARGGQGADRWQRANDRNYQNIGESILQPQGLTPAQVQVVWLKNANPNVAATLPDPNAEAFLLVSQLGQALRTLKQVYPNLQQVFLSSSTYGGYSNTSKHPEPNAYETGFAVKWLIEAQIRQMETGEIDPLAGDLNYESGAAPWIAWGPYLWADGPNPRADGLAWNPQDIKGDAVHLQDPGREKVVAMLLDFFKNSPLTRCWFSREGCS